MGEEPKNDMEEKVEGLLRENLDLFDVRNRTYSPSPHTDEPCDFCEEDGESGGSDAVSTFEVPNTDLVLALCVDCLTEYA